MENMDKFEAKDILKILWMALKLAIVLFAIFHATNVTVLYQSF